MNPKKETAIKKAIKKLGEDAPKRALAREANVNRGTLQRYLEEQGIEVPEAQEQEIDQESYKYLKERLGMPDWMIDQYGKLLSEDPKAALKLIQGSPEVRDKSMQMSPEVERILHHSVFIQTGVWEMYKEEPPQWVKPSIKFGRYYNDDITPTQEERYCEKCKKDSMFYITKIIEILEGKEAQVIQCQNCKTEYRVEDNELKKCRNIYEDTSQFKNVTA